jgi:ribosomal protein L20
LINGLNKTNVGLDRKTLADIAVRDPLAFQRLADVARAHLTT